MKYYRLCAVYCGYSEIVHYKANNGVCHMSNILLIIMFFPIPTYLFSENCHYLNRTFTVRFRCLLDNTSGFIVSTAQSNIGIGKNSL